MSYNMKKFLQGPGTECLPAGLKEYCEPIQMAALLVGRELTEISVEEFKTNGLGRCPGNFRQLKRVLVEIGGRAALLTDAEKIIFDKILTGSENKKIADSSGVTQWNVKFHSVNVCRLFGVNRKAELMALAIKK